LKEIIESQYCEFFIAYVHSRLFKQQAKPVDVDVEDTTSVEDALASEAPAPVDPVDEAPTEEVTSEVNEAPASEAPAEETSYDFPDFLFQRISIEDLRKEGPVLEIVAGVAKTVMRPPTPDALKLAKHAVELLAGKKINLWGEIFTRKSEVEALIANNTRDAFNQLFALMNGVLKCGFDTEFSGLEQALKPYLEAYAQEQAEMAVQSEAKREEEQRVSKRALVEKLLDKKIGDLRECKLIMDKASVGCKKYLSHFVNDALISSEDSKLRFMMEYPLRDALNETEKTLKKWMGTSQRVNALKECIEHIKELGV
jgi:hypothetical protein